MSADHLEAIRETQFGTHW